MSIVYHSAPIYIYIYMCDTLPLDNQKIHLYTALPYITISTICGPVLGSHTDICRQIACVHLREVSLYIFYWANSTFVQVKETKGALSEWGLGPILGPQKLLGIHALESNLQLS